MQRLPVDSTDLVSIGYDAKTRLLEIEFKEGRVYEYSDVPADVYERFTKTDSYGQYFYAFINGHYRYKRVEQEADKPHYEGLAFVTGNARKVADLEGALQPYDIKVEQLDLPVDEIQGTDPEKIALHKAKEAFRLAGRSVLVNDVFWNITALRGFPGPYMHDIAGWLKPEDWLALMQDKTDRSVSRTQSVVYYDGKRSKIFTKVYWATMITEPRGIGDSSIGQLLMNVGDTRTFAERRDAGDTTLPAEENIWHEFAKWYHMQRRIGRA
jgi:XTP/dITP diphosphohydrolase